MRIVDILLGEFMHEAAQTRKMLERIPADTAAFVPHEKSMPMGKLVTHVADLASWTALTLNGTELDLAGGYVTPPFTTTEALLAFFDKNVEDSKQALMAATDDQLEVTWTLRAGPQVLLAMPRGQILRNMCYNHTVHHRGQLMVLQRLMGIVPHMTRARQERMAAAAAAAQK